MVGTYQLISTNQEIISASSRLTFNEVHRLVGMHQLVGPADTLLQWIVIVHGVVSKLGHIFVGEAFLRPK